MKLRFLASNLVRSVSKTRFEPDLDCELSW